MMVTHATRRYICFDILVTACKFARFQIHVKKDFTKLLKLQEIFWNNNEVLMTVYPTVFEINIMIFIWVLTWFHFKFKKISFKNCWKQLWDNLLKFHNLVFDIQRVNIEWNLNSDADYTGNIVDGKIISVTWLIFETFICCIIFK